MHAERFCCPRRQPVATSSRTPLESLSSSPRPAAAHDAANDSVYSVVAAGCAHGAASIASNAAAVSLELKPRASKAATLRALPPPSTAGTSVHIPLSCARCASAAMTEICGHPCGTALCGYAVLFGPRSTSSVGPLAAKAAASTPPLARSRRRCSRTRGPKPRSSYASTGDVWEESRRSERKIPRGAVRGPTAS